MFYDSRNVLSFSKDYDKYTKNTLITHLSEALTQITNMDYDLTKPKTIIQLRDRPDFKSLLKPKPKKQSFEQREVLYLSPDHIVRLLQIHMLTPTINSHRCIFLLFTGARFENSLLDRKPHCLTLSPHATRRLHSPHEACKIETFECFNILSIETKTNQNAKLYIHPAIYNSYLFLKNEKIQLSDNRILQTTNQFLSQNINPSFSSHSLRRTLPNLTFNDTNRNTGIWKSNAINSYISFTTRISELVHFANQQTKYFVSTNCNGNQ